MECLECESKTGVVDTIKYAGAVYRQRHCKACGFEFWTEELEVEDPTIITEALNYKKRMYRERKNLKRSKKWIN